jgi:D-alanyl-lipoteichoic acid acyltransferase DltB (MBOAT superfamily)
MALGGLWHGAAWTFVLWGLYQGVVLVIARMIHQWADRAGIVVKAGLTVPRLVLGLLYFQVTCYGWLIFRAQSVQQLAHFTRLIFTDLRVTSTTIDSLLLPMLQVVVPLLMLHVYQARKGSEDAPLRWPLLARYALYAAVFYFVLLWGDFEGAQFIYFQF